MWKSLIIAAAILALGCVGAGYFVATSKAVQDQLRALDPSQKLTEVRVNTAAKGSLVRVVSAPGTTEPETKAEISAQVAARILELPFREGASVKRGDVIARLDAVDLVANLNASKANLRAEEMRLLGLRSALTNAESEMARQKKLLETNDTSKARFDQALTDYERARSSVQAGEAEVEAARAGSSAPRRTWTTPSSARPLTRRSSSSTARSANCSPGWTRRTARQHDHLLLWATTAAWCPAPRATCPRSGSTCR